jgi:hypothetical protein
MKIPPEIPVFGNLSYRNKHCPRESVEQITLINKIRAEYPDTYGRVLVHCKNEAKLINGQFAAINKDKAMGMAKGASDIIIVGKPAFVCEMKRQDASLCVLDDDQISYLLAAKDCGAFVCVALGYLAAMEAFNDWIKINKK